MATGSTPLGVYNELVRMHREESLDFSQVTTFNLDEYVGLPVKHEQSYHYFMHENFFKHVNIPRENIHIPSGTTRNYRAFCEWYEAEIAKHGGVDVQLLGIGANGHIAFNEPGSSLGSRTRVKTLTDKTRQDNARFVGSPEEVPKYAITMGVGTILEAKEILLMANGAGKADAIKAAVEGPITSQCPASVIQLHRKTYVIVTRDAAAKLGGSYPGTWKSSIMLDR